MELFPPGKTLRLHAWSDRLHSDQPAALVLGSFALFFYPGPKLGTDLQRWHRSRSRLQASPSSAGDIREAVKASGFSSPESSRSTIPRTRIDFLIRVQEVSVLSEPRPSAQIERALCLR